MDLRRRSFCDYLVKFGLRFQRGLQKIKAKINVCFLQEKTLVYDPLKRISAKAALQHPYFDNLVSVIALQALSLAFKL